MLGMNMLLLMKLEDISEKLSKFWPSESNGLIGIDQTISQIQSLLIKESSEILFLRAWLA